MFSRKQKVLEDQITEVQPCIADNNKQKRPSIMDMIREKQNDQDFNQKLNVGITLILEIYRVLMGAFLVVFVPQKCEETICSTSQNINRNDSLSQAAISFNIITSLSFLALYFIEVKRENKMINYLEVNKFTATDNESVGIGLEKLAIVKKQSIWDYDGYYQKAGYVSTIAFTLNAVLSFIVVYTNYLDSKTFTVFLTNLLLMGLKVADVFSTVNTPKNIFYSAYLKNKVQYNDVDPDKIQQRDDIESRVTELPNETNLVEEEPVVEEAEAPVVQEAEEPVVEEAEAPVVQEAEAPVVQEAEAPVVQEADEPVVQEADEPVVQEADEPADNSV